MAAPSRIASRASTLLALVIPPLASLWLITAALLPRLWMTSDVFAAQHAAPFHEIHLLGTLTFAIEPTLAYAMVFFIAATACFVLWSNVRGSCALVELSASWM